MRTRLIAAVALCLCRISVADGDEVDLRGAYGAPGREIVIVTRWGDDLYLLDMTTGEARRLAAADDQSFVHGPTRSTTEPIAGRVRFEVVDERVRALERSPSGQSLPRIPLATRPVEFDNGDQARLMGTLVAPSTTPRAWILFLAGDGPNTRDDNWDVAAWLGAHGIGSLIFDKRGAGESTGVEIEGNYHARSTVAASDATAAMRFLLSQKENADLPVGVGGRSQGGWLGAIVAREVPETAFYVNLAGNGSPGWAQWRHAMTTWLHRKQVSLDEIASAGAYFDAFFGVYDGRVGWDEYTRTLERARDEAWWPVMRQRYVAEWESLAEAEAFAKSETAYVPAEDFRRVSVPSLGLFFEHDHSTTPETPQIFLEALREGGNGDVTVRVFPGADHGAWVLDGYRADRSKITHRLTEPFELMRDWILALTH